MNGVFVERKKIAKKSEIKLCVGAEIVVGGQKPSLPAGAKLPRNIESHVYAFRLQQTLTLDRWPSCPQCNPSSPFRQLPGGGEEEEEEKKEEKASGSGRGKGKGSASVPGLNPGLGVVGGVLPCCKEEEMAVVVEEEEEEMVVVEEEASVNKHSQDFICL